MRRTLGKRRRGKALRARKTIYQLFCRRSLGRQRSVLFIIGCQRSGTTLMARILERDLRTAVYGEFGSLSSLDRQHGIRLNPLPLVEAEIERDRVPLAVLKPLVETQNALRLLEHFPDSRVLWMYRNYRDVASSNLAAFGVENALRNLRVIVQNAPEDWRSENVSEATRDIVLRHFSEHMNPYDATALFWVVRNRLFFELGLDRHPRVTMCEYQNLLARPEAMFRAIYRFTGTEYPSNDILAPVRPDAGRGKGIELAPEVELLCKELLERLEQTYATRSVLIATA